MEGLNGFVSDSLYINGRRIELVQRGREELIISGHIIEYAPSEVISIEKGLIISNIRDLTGLISSGLYERHMMFKRVLAANFGSDIVLYNVLPKQPIIDYSQMQEYMYNFRRYHVRKYPELKCAWVPILHHNDVWGIMVTTTAKTDEQILLDKSALSRIGEVEWLKCNIPYDMINYECEDIYALKHLNARVYFRGNTVQRLTCSRVCRQSLKFKGKEAIELFNQLSEAFPAHKILGYYYDGRIVKEVRFENDVQDALINSNGNFQRSCI